VSAERPLGLVLDCDGVLVDSEGLASRVEAEVLRDLGVQLTVDEAHAMFLGKTVAGVLEAVEKRTGTTPTPGFTYNWAFATAHAFMRELQPVPYLRAALEELRRRGHPMAVASQSPLARVRMSLEVAGLTGFFADRVCVTSMVARPKPAPDVYLLAAQRLQLEPSACVVVEDSPAGAAAASAAGMRAILYAPGPASAPAGAGNVRLMHSMDELPGLIAALR
jgi:HAD superfamily hydrolase (TIGR01509 family)